MDSRERAHCTLSLTLYPTPNVSKQCGAKHSVCATVQTTVLVVVVANTHTHTQANSLDNDHHRWRRRLYGNSCNFAKLSSSLAFFSAAVVTALLLCSVSLCSLFCAHCMLLLTRLLTASICLLLLLLLLLPFFFFFGPRLMRPNGHCRGGGGNGGKHSSELSTDQCPLWRVLLMLVLSLTSSIEHSFLSFPPFSSLNPWPLKS